MSRGKVSHYPRVAAPGEKAVVSLDLQLFINAELLVSTRNELKDNFIIKAGGMTHSLHDVYRKVNRRE